MNNLLIQNGHLIDPAANIDAHATSSCATAASQLSIDLLVRALTSSADTK